MARDLFINGEVLVAVKGPQGSLISSLSELGLSADGDITITPQIFQDEVTADAWGDAPFEVQLRLSTVTIDMTLVHFDQAVLQECWRLSLGGPQFVGQVARAGARMGSNLARFAAGNNFMGLNLTSPIAGLPYRFYYTYLTQQPLVWPLGTKRSLAKLNWKAIPAVADPWQGGQGATNYTIWDRVLDS